MHDSIIEQVWGNVCTFFLRAQHWVDLRVFDEEMLTNKLLWGETPCACMATKVSESAS